MAKQDPPSPLRLLIIEDSINDAELILRELRKNGRSVEFERIESRETLHTALRNGSWDVVLSDYRLPQILGDEVLTLVRRHDPEMPFIFVSGTIGEEAAVELLKAGADDYVMKGNLTRLPSSIERAMRQREERRARQRSEHTLRESEERFRQLSENISAFFYLTDPANTEVFYASPAYEAIWGRSVASLYDNPRSWLDAVHTDDQARVTRTLEKRTQEQREVGYRIVRPDGAVRWIRSRGFPVRDEQGLTHRIAAIVEDETERKLAEDRIRRLNRVYAVLSGINALIVRVHDRDELFREACRIAVAEGEFVLARVIEFDSTGKARIAATSEVDSRLFQRIVDEYNSDPEHSPSLLALARHSEQPLVSNDVARDLRIPNRAALTKDGNYALALLPIILEKRVVGTFLLRAKDPDMFDEGELRLLLEMVSDMAFALDHISKEERLNYLAMYDQLTGLANRTLLLERLQQFIHAAAARGEKLALIVSDLERFRAVNDSLGRQAGDLLLTQFADRLRKCVSDPGQLARVGADHFAIVLPEASNEFVAARLLGDLAKRCVEEAFGIGLTGELRIAAKAGIALYPDHGADAESLLKNAGAALKACKVAGERHLFFERRMTERVAEKLTLETRLRRALEREEFVLHYQPRIDLEARSIQGVEALIRWQTEKGLVPPAKFIPLLEETGLILEVGAWALRRAVLEHQIRMDQGIRLPRIAVNVSTVQLHQRDFVPRLKRAIEHGASPPNVDLEITESMLMQDVQGNIDKLREVRKLGLKVAIDDFGTGHSSLSYLARLPVDSLKIDRSFIITMLSDPNTMTLVSTMISLAHSLGLKVVAEGVDAEEQAKTLRLLKCDEMQGYLFSKPLPVDKLVILLGKGVKDS